MSLHNLPRTEPDVETRASQVAGVQSKNIRSTERRRYDRQPCHDPVEIRRVPVDGTSWPATILDVSRSGLGIALDVPLSQRSRIEVIFGEWVMFGEVRHCRRIGKAFRAGIIIEAVFRSKPLPKAPNR